MCLLYRNMMKLLLFLVLLTQPWQGQTRAASPEQVPEWAQPDTMKKRIELPARSSVRFHCPAIGNPKPTLKWLKNGTIFKKEHRKRGFRVRDSLWMIILDLLELSDRGNYTCVVENKHGSISHSYQLDIIERYPQRPILQPGLPANRTAVVGSDVEFECKVSGYLQPHIQWLKHIEVNGKKVTEAGLPYIRVIKATGFNTTKEDMEVLQLKNVSLEDAGIYTCLAGNEDGIAHQSAWLTVYEERVPQRPILQAGLPADRAAVVGSNVEFECKVYSDLPPHIQWLKHIEVNGSKVGEGGLPYVKVVKSAGIKTMLKEMEVLQLKNVSLEDAGMYTCLAGNSKGYSHHSAWLTVYEAEKIPSGVEAASSK